jgi:2-phosphosulfolactate phosphatase
MTREEVRPERLAGAVAVVIDVFLATTTLLTILENGARSVYPVGTLEEAEEVRRGLDGARLLRGGEQGAERIPGYDLGPYPEEYPPGAVAGRDVVFVTTNGTRAISDVSPADRVLLGCLRNAPAVARHLEGSRTRSVYLVCAGSGGRFTLEDFAGAAAIASRMDLSGWCLNDAARLALDFASWRGHDPEGALERGRAGRWFLENGRAEVLKFAADVGASDLVPEVKEGKLRRAGEREVVVDVGAEGE